MNVTNTPLYIFQNNLPYAFSEKKFSPAFKRSTNKDTFEKTTDKIVQTKYGTIHYHDGKFLYFDFNHPKNLNDALKAIKYVQKKYTLSTFGVATYDYNYKDYQKAFSKKFGNMKFTRYLGSGNTAMAIENEDGKVLKLSAINQFSFNRKPEKFDARVYDAGRTDDGYYYYIQEKCDRRNIKQQDIDKITKMIKDSGYTPFDMSEDQVGIAKDGRVYLIDPECAKDDKALELMREKCQKWALEHGLDYDFI